MRDQQLPKFLVVGIASDTLGMTIWRVQRAGDLAICAAEHGYRTDDGVVVSRPVVREWLSCAQATAYAEAMEAGMQLGDEPDVWVPQPPFFSEPAPRHIDGPL